MGDALNTRVTDGRSCRMVHCSLETSMTGKVLQLLLDKQLSFSMSYNTVIKRPITLLGCVKRAAVIGSKKVIFDWETCNTS